MAQEYRSLNLATADKDSIYKIETDKETYYVRLLPKSTQLEGAVRGVMVHGSVSISTAPRETVVQSPVEEHQLWRINGIPTRERITRISISA